MGEETHYWFKRITNLHIIADSNPHSTHPIKITLGVVTLHFSLELAKAIENGISFVIQDLEREE